MNIVQVANFVTPTSGGLRTALSELSSFYRRTGHRCVTIVPRFVQPSFDPRHVVALEIPGRQLPMSGGYRVIMERRNVITSILSCKPDVVELHAKTTLSWVAGWCESKGIPCVTFSHERTSDVVEDRLPRFLPLARLVKGWSNLVASRSSGIVCASKFAAAEFKDFESKVQIIPFGADLNTFSPIRHAGEAASRRATYVGRLSPEKCPQLLIHAARLLRDRGTPISVTIVGDGPSSSELMAMAAGLDVEFVGRIDDRVLVATIMAESAVIVAPSPFETFGLSVVEALASGTPVVVPHIGAGQELVAPGCGVVAPFSAAGFAVAIEQVLAWDRDSTRATCRDHAVHYSWDRTGASLLSFYDEIIRIGQRSVA